MVTILRDEDVSEETYQCVICKGTFNGWGNNPYPIRQDGRCCDQCNQDVVVRARLNGITHSIETL